MLPLQSIDLSSYVSLAVLKLWLIANGELGCRIISDTQKMGIIFIKRANRHKAVRKANPLIIGRIPQDKYRPALDWFLRQAISQQLGTYPLIMKFRFYRHRRQMEPADLFTLIGS